jgi:hypothetical protein
MGLLEEVAQQRKATAQTKAGGPSSYSDQTECLGSELGVLCDQCR